LRVENNEKRQEAICLIVPGKSFVLSAAATTSGKGILLRPDILVCRFCKSGIIIYDEYIHKFICEEAARMLAKFMETDSEHDLAMLKHALSQPHMPKPQRTPRSLRL
jgi:hypothetical protein